MSQDYSEQRDMSKPPSAAPTGYNPSHHQPHDAGGAAAPAPAPTAAAAAPHSHPAPQPPPPPQQQQQQHNEGKTFCPTENKPGEAETNKVYGTFKNTAAAVAFRRDSCSDSTGPLIGGSTTTTSSSCLQGRGTGSVQSGGGDPLRTNTEQNNASSGNWTAMSQTTIVLGTDGNTSVQPVAVVSDLKCMSWPSSSVETAWMIQRRVCLLSEQVHGAFD